MKVNEPPHSEMSPHGDDYDVEDWGPGCAGVGSASTIQTYEPTPEELEKINNRWPIGFVHFDSLKPARRRQSVKRGRK
jgi:hypothetical protein